jgi:hypothetical protein
LQKRGKRYDPLIFPANSPKNSRNGIGCIHRNPTKGIERPTYWAWFVLNYPYVAFTEIPQRELRVIPDIAAVGIDTFVLVAFNEIPERELRAHREKSWER